MNFALNINHEELKLGNEIPTLLKLRLKKLLSGNGKPGGKILVIDTCIIGDFLATLPALRAFIEERGRKVDLVVSPPLRSLAEAVRGVDRVFTARSVYDRQNEQAGGAEPPPGEYGLVLVLRISPDAYDLLDGLKFSDIITYDIPYFKYIGHLVKNILLKKEVKQWREVNYEMTGMKEPARKPGFDDIFDLGEDDYASVAKLEELGGNSKKIIIHTGSGWKVKLWDNEKWIELIRKIDRTGDFRFILIGGGAFEQEAFRRIQQGLDFKIYSLINKIDLKEALLAMRLCDYFIGIDSGPRNMAHLADLRSVSMLGPAPKNFMPPDGRDIVIDKFDCRCKSLFYLHKESGMQRISSDEVLESFKRLPGRPAAAPSPREREAVAA